MMAKEHIQLSETERKQLEDLLSHGNIAARKSRRILAILELDRGRTFKSVAQTVGVTKQAVSLWARNYRENGLAGLDDKPIPGRPPIISGAERAKITALACSDAPAGHGQWSLRLLAEKAVELAYVEHISPMHVGRILKKTTSNPT